MGRCSEKSVLCYIIAEVFKESKAKVIIGQAMKAQMGNGGIVLLFL
jgi:hypothetical protein